MISLVILIGSSVMTWYDLLTKLRSNDPETQKLANYIFTFEGKLLRPKFAMLLALSLAKEGLDKDEY